MKLFGPVQFQEVPWVTDKVSVAPEHTGVLLETAGTGEGFTVTDVLVTAVHPFTSVTVTVYVPEAFVVTSEITGF
jgi:hypothetical protein